VNLFGGCAAGTEVSIPTRRIHYDELTILGTYHHDPSCVREALQLLSEGVGPAEEVITGRAPLTKLPEVIRGLANGLGTIKLAIMPVER